ncbi:MAG: 3'(2'),5'-bisphosphate nucleotidase, partial [Planctomycetota bacterium]|nr:3'(2'),5'-bisphosphate nucleotidase [Planctomycetota bacterium]
MRLNIAIDAVRQASLAAKSVQHDLGRVSELTKDDRSPVTVADFAAQAIVASILRDADASTPLVGEETSAVLREPENDALLGLVTEAVSSAIGQRTREEVLTLLDH